MRLIKKIIKFLGEASKLKATRPSLLLRLSVVLAFFAILIFLAQLWNANQSIHKISIVGTSFLSPSELRAELDEVSIINVPKNKINYTELARKLKGNPYVEETFMNEGINTLTIEIKERRPIAILADNYGKIKYLDENGVVLPYRLFYSSIDLPIITGVYKDELLDTFNLLASLNIIKHIRSQKNNLLNNLISEVHYNRNSNEFLLYTSDDTKKIIFGKNENIEEKLLNLNDFLKFQLNFSGKVDYEYIDIRWNDRIIVKNKNI